jgi:pyruvate kinase
MPRTKIVCTLGPASETEETLRAMLRAGMDVARLNFSHGTHEDHARRMALVRRLAKEEGKVIAILQDLQGPKLRIGRLVGGRATLREGDPITLIT